MKVRPLDSNGDYTPIYSLSQMIEGSSAVAQVVTLRLQFYNGEWWEDPDIGFLAPEFLVENARSGDVEMLGKYIASYISNTQGVSAIEDVVAEYDRHELVFHCLVLTEDGETEEVEVNVDGVF